MEPVIHHHFKISKKFFENPCRFNKLRFKYIPLFKLYSLLYLNRLRELIEMLSNVEMPHSYQQAVTQLIILERDAYHGHRTELIPLTYCEYNRQSFFVRAYQLRHNRYFKIEVTMHSTTLGRGKYYSLQRAYEGATNFFERIEEGEIKPLSPLGNHVDDFFFYETLKEQVNAFNNALNTVRSTDNGVEKGFLKGKLIESLQDFQATARVIAKENIEQLRLLALTDTIHANLENR